MPDYFYSDLFILSVQAGDEENAVGFIQKTSADVQMTAYGKLAVVWITAGDVVGADKAVEHIDGIFSAVPHEPATEVLERPYKPSSQDRHDLILCDIAKAFAMKGDISRAQALKKISNKGSLSGVLAEIAKARHKTGDQQGADETLKQFKSSADEYYAKDPVQVAILESLAFGLAGEPDKARDLIAALPLEQSREIAYSRLSDALAKDSDIIHAGEIADEIGGYDDLILIGKVQHGAGNDAEAGKTFLAANQTLSKDNTIAHYDKLSQIGEIVGGLISAGDFSDAVSISAAFDDLNRSQYIVKVFREELKGNDMRAIRDTAPIALKIADFASKFNEKDLTDLTLVLNQAGMKKDAISVLNIAQKNADHLSGWQKMDALNEIKAAQVALDDKEGAAKTEQAIQQETVVFNQAIEMLPSQGTAQANAGDAANYGEVIKLLQQFQASNDPQAQKEMIQRATKLLGNNANALEPLMFISARYSSDRQKLNSIADDLAHNDFSSATKMIDSMTGSYRDAGLGQLVRAEAKADQWKQAFDAACAIADPFQRASSLIGIISVEAPPATP